MTKAELAKLALQMLGVISSQETPTAADSTDMQAVYDRLYAELSERRLAVWPQDTIPDYCAEHVARIMGVRMRPQFTGEQLTPEALVQAENVAMRPLVSLLRGPKTEKRTEAEYF